MSIVDNIARVRENIHNAALRAGRSPNEITLIAVTKYVDTDRILQAVNCGIADVGENRVQEYTQKSSFFDEQKLNTHIIGQLQSNKVKYVIGRVRLIQSVDRLSLAEAVSRHALKNGIVQDVLVEVNIGNEPQKGGVLPECLSELIFKISALESIRVKGLMCVPPAVGANDVRGFFAKMRRLYSDTAALGAAETIMEHLSMGMSGDYEEAVKEGATMIRVGSAIFGERA